MKAYITTIGERTTDICIWQLKRLGFETIVLDKKESWIDKYKRFIFSANEDCLRIDADIIPNDLIFKELKNKYLMTQFSFFDFYKNKVSIGQPVFYKKEVFDIIRKNIDKIDVMRPETSAWRLKEVNKQTYTSPIVAGMHGFFQDKETIARAMKNKIDRKQIEDYDFELSNRIIDILC